MRRIPPASSLLWRSLRVYQVYGANTDVGKTVLSTILCKAARRLWRSEETAFLKPVSTGPAEAADDRYDFNARFNDAHIRKFAPEIATKTLFQYDLASIPSDEVILEEIARFAGQQASRGPGWLFVETAGGVHSPSPSGSTQADMYRPLRLPVVLVGDSKLGGISQTISAFESLKVRGYDVESVLLFREATYQNHRYLADYFGQRHGIPVKSLPEPPKRVEDAAEDALKLSRYYEESSHSDEMRDVLAHLDARHKDRIARLESMSAAAHKTIWYPFTQHKHLTPDKITVIDSAQGDYFQTLAPPPTTSTTSATETTTPPPPPPPAQPTSTPNRDDPNPGSLLHPSFDGSASWWTQGLGHGSPQLALAAAYAAGRYGHVMFAEAAHEPALALAEALLCGLGNRRLARAFFSDNGSTGVEVAVKMALRAARGRYGWDGSAGEGKVGVLGLRGSYHGDTIGAMDCSEPGVFNEKVEWYEGKGFWFAYPVVEYRRGEWVVEVPVEMRHLCGGCERFRYSSLSEVFDVVSREQGPQGRVYEQFITATLERLAAQGRQFGALMLEPVVLGAGGMLLVDPLFQRTLVKVVRRSAHLFGGSGSPGTDSLSAADDDGSTWTGLPVIFDEVFTGLYRLGRFSAASFLGVDADVSVHAKLLTGGLVPLSVTLASESIFAAFESDDKSDALLHGHSYTAHAVGCQVALETVREMQRMEASGAWDWARARAARERSGAATGEAPAQSLYAPGDLVWSVWSPEFVSWAGQLPEDFMGGVWALGSVLALRLASVDGSQGYKGSAAKAVHAALLQGRPGDEGRWNVHSRVLGNTLYLMAGQKTTQASIEGVEALLRGALLETQAARQA
ncbi:bc58ca73-f959-41e4-8e78-16159de37723 [Thermothielavioides terrestris]|uniref:Bc58ca73-f959-41e4-8e78-16159de37723 n=1 Tax=Thermothielavioides terrestris TaxID=2587410 RepID=A0A3S4BRD8_9PEZI|nr:bc58ca73-f959-41e4-8e78-16159de37723 [Thermothielavioides terrestris]